MCSTARGRCKGFRSSKSKRALEACLGALAEDDRFGIIAFDDKVERFDSEMSQGDKHQRARARNFLAAIEAQGGTELAQAITAAVKLLRQETGDILIMTDGQVFGTGERVNLRRRAVRVHWSAAGSFLASPSGGRTW